MQARLGDANRNLAARVLLLTAELAKAMGPAFDRVGRQLLIASMASLHDNKKQVGARVPAIPSLLRLSSFLFSLLIYT